MVDLRIAGAVTMPKDAVWEALYPGVYEFYFQAFDDMLQGNYEQAYGRFAGHISIFSLCSSSTPVRIM